MNRDYFSPILDATPDRKVAIYAVEFRPDRRAYADVRLYWEHGGALQELTPEMVVLACAHHDGTWTPDLLGADVLFQETERVRNTYRWDTPDTAPYRGRYRHNGQHPAAELAERLIGRILKLTQDNASERVNVRIL